MQAPPSSLQRLRSGAFAQCSVNVCAGQKRDEQRRRCFHIVRIAAAMKRNEQTPAAIPPMMIQSSFMRGIAALPHACISQGAYYSLQVAPLYPESRIAG